MENTPHTCAHMHYEMVEKRFALQVRLALPCANPGVTYPLPPFPLSFPFPKCVILFFLFDWR